MPTGRRKNEGSDWTRRYREGGYDADDAESKQRFSNRSKFAQQVKMRQTAELRAGNQEIAGDMAELPLGEVIQVFSLFVEVRVLAAGQGETLIPEMTYLAVMRRTVQRLAKTDVVVGDWVRIRATGKNHDSGVPEASIEQVLPRRTVLTRQDSFHKDRSDVIVANAGQMLIVASILRPAVKWGLVDRMLIAAESGGLRPIVCLNKMDLADDAVLANATAVLEHYRTLGVQSITTSVDGKTGLDEVKQCLADQTTVLAGHSGVGKSSLIMAIAPGLDIRVGEVSNFNDKGRHTTSSARRYELPFGGQVIDTPGIKQFGLVDVSVETLTAYFPDVSAGTAPQWREESYRKILESL